MNSEFPIHLVGEILWLPVHEQGTSVIPPESNFRALAKFTADYLPSYTVLVSYSTAVSEQGFHDVRLNFAFAKDEELRRLCKNSEILILDGYKILAICRNINYLSD